jgi:hypothetical protein
MKGPQGLDDSGAEATTDHARHKPTRVRTASRRFRRSPSHRRCRICSHPFGSTTHRGRTNHPVVLPTGRSGYAPRRRRASYSSCARRSFHGPLEQIVNRGSTTIFGHWFSPQPERSGPIQCGSRRAEGHRSMEGGARGKEVRRVVARSGAPCHRAHTCRMGTNESRNMAVDGFGTKAGCPGGPIL